MMNKQQAKNILEQALGQITTTWENHQLLRQALVVLSAEETIEEVKEK